MTSRNKAYVVLLAVALLLAFPSAALAGETDGRDAAVRDVPVTDEVVTDAATEKPTDVARQDPVTDVAPDRITDRPTDRVTDHCRKHVHGDLRPHCVDDRHPHDFNVRKLILRLIHAGEWEKLVRLLHWLGWI